MPVGLLSERVGYRCTPQTLPEVTSSNASPISPRALNSWAGAQLSTCQGFTAQFELKSSLPDCPHMQTRKHPSSVDKIRVSSRARPYPPRHQSLHPARSSNEWSGEGQILQCSNYSSRWALPRVGDRISWTAHLDPKMPAKSSPLQTPPPPAPRLSFAIVRSRKGTGPFDVRAEAEAQEVSWLVLHFRRRAFDSFRKVPAQTDFMSCVPRP